QDTSFRETSRALKIALNSLLSSLGNNETPGPTGPADSEKAPGVSPQNLCFQPNTGTAAPTGPTDSQKAPGVSPQNLPLQPNAPDTSSAETMLDPTFHFVFSTLSSLQGEALARLRFRDLVQEWMDTRDLPEAEAIEAISHQSRHSPFWSYNTIDVSITQSRRMRPAGLIPDPTRHTRHQLSADQDLPGSDSRLTTPDSRLTTPDSRLPSSVTLAEN